ncbi:GENE II AND X PROTEINS [Janthinobacterium sp. CG23_2]|nr:GENE II AND X PROTEINS [Janthinobacterium sp. CG23_2]CUU31934.1 GENE II AND X PROTEINS [Janthinobacterium sp. CG23_2]
MALIASRWAAERKQSLTGAVTRVPTASQIDRRLVLGGQSVGAGWGWPGYCAGPALASLAKG